MKDMQVRGVGVCLAGLRPEFVAALRRLQFDEWFSEKRLLAHGAKDYSATLAAFWEVQALQPMSTLAMERELTDLVRPPASRHCEPEASN